MNRDEEDVDAVLLDDMEGGAVQPAANGNPVNPQGQQNPVQNRGVQPQGVIPTQPFSGYSQSKIFDSVLIALATCLSNADNLATLVKDASQTFVDNEKATDYRYTGRAAMVCSVLTLITIMIYYLKFFFQLLKALYNALFQTNCPGYNGFFSCASQKNNGQPSSGYLVHVYFALLTVSCVLSIIGSSLLITDQCNSSEVENNDGTITRECIPPKHPSPEDTNLHVWGAIFVATAKVLNPVITTSILAFRGAEVSLKNNDTPDAQQAPAANRP